MLDDNGVEGAHHPEKMHIGGNAEMTAKELHSPVGSWSDYVRQVSAEVTDQNLRHWTRLVLEFLPIRRPSWGSTSSRMCGWRW